MLSVYCMFLDSNKIIHLKKIEYAHLMPNKHFAIKSCCLISLLKLLHLFQGSLMKVQKTALLLSLLINLIYSNKNMNLIND